jgi:ribokinase
MYDVITFGSATQDVFLRSKELELHKEHGVVEACFPFGAKIDVEEMNIETGGGGTNAAVTFARMAGMRTAVAASIGNDPAGEDVIRAMKREGVSAEFFQKSDKEMTGYSAIILSGAAERTILTHRGASAALNGQKIPWGKISAKLFYVSSLAGNLGLLEKILDRARKANAKVFMNPGGGEIKQNPKNVRRLFSRLDLLVLNREEAAALLESKTKNMRTLVRAIRKICPLAVITDGSAGAYAITPAAVIHAAVLPAKKINLTGAGDAFGSAFAAGMVRNKDLPTALALGTLNATSVVQKMGAKVGILRGWPSVRELKSVKIKNISF